jgi:hypothetical protein
VHDQQPVVHTSRTDVAAFGFLGAATVVSGVQAAFLLHDAASWRRVQRGLITTWQHVPYLESLLALIDLAVLAVAVLVLLTTFAERRRHASWAAVAWLFIALATVLEWRLLGLRVGDGSTDSSFDLGPDYGLRAHEAVGATLMCAAALAAAALALHLGRNRSAGRGT